MSKNNKKPLKTSLLVLFVLTMISSVFLIIILIFNNNLSNFLMEPLITPTDYLSSHPWFSFNTKSGLFFISEPSSSFFVYGLGILTIIIGIQILKTWNMSESNSHFKQNLKYWGISLIFWGIGTLFAGTSYQMLFYELKCKGNTYCLWTTWLEIVYLVLTVVSVNFMVFAQSYSAKNQKTKNFMQYYAYINLNLYQILLILGMTLQIRFVLTFEMMVVFLLPSFFFMMIQNSIWFNKNKEKKDLQFIWLWIILAIVMIAYYAFYLSNIPDFLWNNGIWFNANDILHIGLVFWMLYIKYCVIGQSEAKK